MHAYVHAMCMCMCTYVISYVYAYVIICLTAPDRARAVVHVVDGLVVVGSRVGAAGAGLLAEAVVDVRCGISIGVVTRLANCSTCWLLTSKLVTELLTNLTGLLAYFTYLLTLLACLLTYVRTYFTYLPDGS